MRLTLNLDTGLLQASPAEIELPALVRTTLGDSPFSVQLVSNRQLLTPALVNGLVTDSARIELVVKPDKNGRPDIAADPVTSGLTLLGDPDYLVPTPPQIISLGEDWQTAAILALFDALPSGSANFVNLWGQFRWRNGGIPALPWTYSLFFLIQVQNTLFPDVLIPPGASLVGAPEYYFSGVDAYVGSDTSLDAIPGAGLADGSLIKAIIGGALSIWLVRKPATLGTSLDDGVIALLDGSAHLERVAGL